MSYMSRVLPKKLLTQNLQAQDLQAQIRELFDYFQLERYALLAE